MGLFPIIMNILQFWLIDSIVKASEVPSAALLTDSLRHAYDDGQREPLFGAPSDDEDEDADAGTLPRHDIENPRTRSRSRDENKSLKLDEHRPTDSGMSTPDVSDGGASVPMHAYPPSGNSVGTNTASSSRGASLMSPPSGESSHKTKRSAPAPLRLQSAYHPAVNSPELSATHPQPTREASGPIVPPSVAKTLLETAPTEDPNKDWASWEDSDDWANKVGEDDWTGRRIEHKRGELSEAWGPSPVPQRHQNIDVAS